MKLILVIVVTFLIGSSRCGLIDGMFGTVTNTTNSIKQNIGGAFQYGRSFVFGSSEPKDNGTGQAVTKPGVIDRISLKIHDVSAIMREGMRSAISMFDGNENQEKGIVGRMLDRVKNRVIKVKNFLFGNSEQMENKPNITVTLNNDTLVLREKLKKYFFRNNTSGLSGIRQTIVTLHDAINRIRNNITENNKNDGTGMIDIRHLSGGMVGPQAGDFVNGIDEAYDKVYDGIDEAHGNAKDLTDTVRQKTNDFIESQKNSLQNNFGQLENGTRNIQNNVDSSDIGTRFNNNLDKVNNVLTNGYSKVDFESEKSRNESEG